MIIEKTLGNIADSGFEIGNRICEKVMLEREELARTHMKVRSDAGSVYAISLDEGIYLEDGSLLYEDEQRIVYVDLIPEDILEIFPANNVEWARAGFNIGNMHYGAYLTESSICIAYDEIIENIIRQLGIHCERCEKKLAGIRANYTHAHSHKHAHTHE